MMKRIMMGMALMVLSVSAHAFQSWQDVYMAEQQAVSVCEGVGGGAAFNSCMVNLYDYMIDQADAAATWAWNQYISCTNNNGYNCETYFSYYYFNAYDARNYLIDQQNSY